MDAPWDKQDPKPYVIEMEINLYAFDGFDC